MMNDIYEAFWRFAEKVPSMFWKLLVALAKLCWKLFLACYYIVFKMFEIGLIHLNRAVELILTGNNKRR